MQFGNSAGNFGSSAVRRPFGHDSAVVLSKLVVLLPNYLFIYLFIYTNDILNTYRGYSCRGDNVDD